MKLTSLRPMLWTNDLDKTIEFYTKVLGFSIVHHNQEIGWVTLGRDEMEIMFAIPSEEIEFKKPFFTGSFYFITDAVDKLWANVKDKATIVYGLENFDWQMREFALLDNNGYMLQFGQEIEISK
jgi:catechol 2,3-dioxygenase-like lactoylglutathione lyase family enzyme